MMKKKKKDGEIKRSTRSDGYGKLSERVHGLSEQPAESAIIPLGHFFFFLFLFFTYRIHDITSYITLPYRRI